jgi:hypothetical protein
MCLQKSERHLQWDLLPKPATECFTDIKSTFLKVLSFLRWWSTFEQVVLEIVFARDCAKAERADRRPWGEGFSGLIFTLYKDRVSKDS